MWGDDIGRSNYNNRLFDRAFLLGPAQAIVSKFLETFAQFPPRPKAVNFNLETVLEKMSATASGGV